MTATMTPDALWQLTQRRDTAQENGRLTECLILDDLLEDHGMHGDDRATCYRCKSWAFRHVHSA